MAFSFRLEALLRFRAHRKERAEIALGWARKQLLQATEALESLQSRLREASEEIRGSLKGRTTAEALKNHVDFVSGLEGRIRTQAQEVLRRREEVQSRTRDLLERTREVRVVEKLEERDYQAWLQEEQRREQKVLDETAVIRHGRTFA